MKGPVWVLAGAVSGFLSVALGAFGAHALRESLSARAMEVYQTAVHYQMFHAVALLALGALFATARGSAGNVAGWAFVTGTVLFSGSLYALAITDIRWLGAITPFGGLAFLGGWLALAWAAYGAL